MIVFCTYCVSTDFCPVAYPDLEKEEFVPAEYQSQNLRLTPPASRYRKRQLSFGLGMHASILPSLVIACNPKLLHNFACKWDNLYLLGKWR